MANLKFLASKEIYSFLASFPKVCVNAVMPLTNKTQHGTSWQASWQRTILKFVGKVILWLTQVKCNPKVIKQAGENEQLNFNFFGPCSLPLLVHSFRLFYEDSHYSTFWDSQWMFCTRCGVNNICKLRS